MDPRLPAMPSPADDVKRRVLLTILALSWVGSMLAWTLLERAGTSSPALRLVFGLNLLFHPAMALVVWRRWWPLGRVDIACLLFAAGLCAACMALRLYAPAWGGRIDLQPLYLWIPVIYVFAFTLPDRRRSLRLSLALLALFVAISLPYLLETGDTATVNFTVQLHVVSGVLIAALHLFASYQHRFHLAEQTAVQASSLANTDALTRLANRRRLAEAIEAELERFLRGGEEFSVVLVDVDHFKHVNDRFGHGVGDRTLVALASRTAELLRGGELLGRWGGEEFVVLLPRTRYEDGLQRAAALCRHVAAAPLVPPHAVTVSCGVTSVTHGDDADTLLHRADVALYAAKRRGRNRAEGLLDGPMEQMSSAFGDLR